MRRSVTATLAEELRVRFAAIQHAQVQSFVYTRETRLPPLGLEIERSALLVSRAIYFALHQAPLPGLETGRVSPLLLRLYSLEPIMDVKGAERSHEAIDAYLRAPESERVGMLTAEPSKHVRVDAPWPQDRTRDPNLALWWVADATMFLKRAMELALEPVHHNQSRMMLNMVAGFSAHAIINAKVPFQSILGLLGEMRGVDKAEVSMSAPGFS